MDTDLIRDDIDMILPDILPIIAGYAIDRGSYYKTFRSVSRLFKLVADRVFPNGDIEFANNRKMTLLRYNMVPTIIDLVILRLPDIPDECVHEHYLLSALSAVKWFDFDKLVENLMESKLIKIACIDKTKKSVGRWLLEQMWVSRVFDIWPKCQLDIPFDIFDKRILGIEQYAPLSVALMFAEENNDVDYKFKWRVLSQNKNITREFYLANLDKPWDINFLVHNPGIDFETAKSIDPLKCLFRLDVPWEYLEPNLHNLPTYGMYLNTRPYCADLTKDSTIEDRWEYIIAKLKEKYSFRYSEKYFEFPAPASWKDEEQRFIEPRRLISDGRYRYQYTQWAKPY